MNKWLVAFIFSISIPLVLGSTQEISGDIEVDYIPFSSAVTLHLSGATVGGELLPIETTAILLAGVQTNLAWIVPFALSVAGISVFILKKKF